MGTQALIYLRVSTAEQSVENQLPELNRVCQQKQWDVVEVLEEEHSAWKGSQVDVEKLLDMAQKHEFDVLVVWSLDRLDRRGILETLQSLKKLDHLGITFYSYQEPYLSTLDPLTRDLIISVLSWVSRMESERISERVKAGMRRARENGQHIGRPRSTTKDERNEIRRMYSEEDLTYRELGQRSGLSTTTVWNIVQEGK